jgi:hypothetical protein
MKQETLSENTKIINMDLNLNQAITNNHDNKNTIPKMSGGYNYYNNNIGNLTKNFFNFIPSLTNYLRK